MPNTDTAPQYQLLAPLGEGGMAVVHLASMTSAAGNRYVAIKQLARRIEVDEVARARLVAEAKLVFQLNHANVVQVLDLGESDDGTYIVMEYVHGCDLRAFTSRERGVGPLDVASCIYVGREVARALDYAHRRADAAGNPLGIVHGDVTPQNILLSVEGEVKLADFGIARAFGVSAPGAGLVGGTPGYMAPEARASVIDHRADVYSLGATLYAALTGDKVDDSGPVLSALTERAGVTGRLRDIVARALAPSPDDRWLSAGDLEQALAVELARRHPEFTPSNLAREVGPHARVSAPNAIDTDTGGETRTIAIKTIMQGAEDDDGVMVVRAPSPAPGARDVDAPPQTATMAPAHERSRRGMWLWAVVAGVAIAAGVAVAGLIVDRDGRGAVAAVATGTEAEGVTEAVPEAEAVLVEDSELDEDEDQDQVQDQDQEDVEARRKKKKKKRKRREKREMGYVTVNAKPWAAVYIDGKLVARETPLYRHRLPAGSYDVVVKFSDDQARSEVKRVVVRAGEHETLGFQK